MKYQYITYKIPDRSGNQLKSAMKWNPIDLFLFSATLSTASDDDEDTEKNKTPTKSSTKSESFERHNFPRDSGCFASSSPASDRSSQQSQSESGIHLPHDDDEDADYSDESNSLGKFLKKIAIFSKCVFISFKKSFFTKPWCLLLI